MIVLKHQLSHVERRPPATSVVPRTGWRRPGAMRKSRINVSRRARRLVLPPRFQTSVTSSGSSDIDSDQTWQSHLFETSPAAAKVLLASLRRHVQAEVFLHVGRPFRIAGRGQGNPFLVALPRPPFQNLGGIRSSCVGSCQLSPSTISRICSPTTKGEVGAFRKAPHRARDGVDAGRECSVPAAACPCRRSS
jgi:hypothetical protein